jgi:uncharacterized protein (DUF1800 family)
MEGDMQITNELAKGQVVALSFAQANVAATQTDVQLKDASGQVEGLTMPFDGEILAISADLSAAATAGTLAVGATINGTEQAASTLSFTTQTARSAKIARAGARFVAGDKLGVEITTSGTWDGTTADLAVVVYVQLNVVGV